MVEEVGVLSPDVLAIVEGLEASAVDTLHVITTRAALHGGMSQSAVDRMNTSGRWTRLTNGVHGVTGKDGGPFEQTYAELLRAGPRAFARRRAAAAIHGGLDLEWDGDIDIAVPQAGSNRRARCRVPEHHVTYVGCLRCTDGLLTLLDLASVLDGEQWEWALEAALRARLTTIEDIEAALAARGRRDLVAVAVVRAVIDVRPAAAPATGSLLETRFLQLLRKHGLPTPERQVCVQISPTKRYFVDVAWPELGLFLELDGKQHETQQLHDADRLAAIVEKTGWTYVTLTWHQVVHTPTYTARRIGRLLEAARRTSA